MILSHYTDAAPWTFQTSGDYGYKPNYDPLHKPDGLWLSVDGPDDWPAWCKSEKWNLGRLRQRHVFTLTDISRIALVSSVDEIDAFHARFAQPVGRCQYVNWDRVGAEFGGVVISPYQWERRLDGPARAWYYGWGCASGCVWDLSLLRFRSSEPFCISVPG